MQRLGSDETTDESGEQGAPEAGEPSAGKAQGRMLRTTAVLPSLCTLSNGLLGFGAIHYATREALGQSRMGDLAIAAWLIFGAMVADMLDGRIARITRRTSDFGGQLDSLCDVISFGAAPAVLMVRTMVLALRTDTLAFLEAGLAAERVIWCIGAVYVACTALRLARFNVENEPDASAHMTFRGLPSPGAAAAIASLVLLFNRLPKLTEGWRADPHFMSIVSLILPAVALAVALLMVSRFRYVHVVNYYVRGRRPFSYLVKIVLLAPAAMVWPFVTLAALAVGYAVSGPVFTAFLRLRRSRKSE